MYHSFRFYVAFCCFAALFAVGCTEKGIRTYEVKGTVQWNGQPVAEAAVYFVPVETNSSVPTAVGETDAQGNFRLTIPTGKFGGGAAVGSYKVTVKKGPGPDVVIDHPSKASVLPAIYADAATTPLKADVVAGKNVFDFTLEGTVR